MIVTAIALKYALLVSHWSDGHFRKQTDSILFENATDLLHLPQRIILISCYTHKNGDRGVTVDSVTSLHLCTAVSAAESIILKYVYSPGGANVPPF